MSDPFKKDLFEIYGSQISLSSIKEYHLGQIEYIMRPVYIDRGKSRWKSFIGQKDNKIEFYRMDYYAAIIGENRYKNAVEETTPNNMLEAVVKTVVTGVADVVSDLTGNKKTKKIRYKTMNAAWRVAEKTFEEIPAVLIREDGKRSEIYSHDELYHLLGEPIAPTIVMVPALFIKSSDGDYVFFGNGIQIQNVEMEYERLKKAVKAYMAIKEKESGWLQNILGLQLPKAPQITIPFLSPNNPKLIEEKNEAKVANDEMAQNKGDK